MDQIFVFTGATTGSQCPLSVLLIKMLCWFCALVDVEQVSLASSLTTRPRPSTPSARLLAVAHLLLLTRYRGRRPLPFSLRGVGWWTNGYATGAPQKIGDGRELLLPTAAVLRLLERRLCYYTVGSAGTTGSALRRPCFANLWAKRSRPSRRPAAFLRLMSA